MIHKRVAFLAFFLITFNLSYGQKSEFDSSANFVTGIFFILSDSTSKDTIFRKIQYVTESTTEWDYSRKQWITEGSFGPMIDKFDPPTDFSRLDSIYFEQDYTIEGLSISITCPGTDLTFQSKNQCIDKYIKTALTDLSTAKYCRVYLTLKVKDSTKRKQSLSFNIYERNSY